MTLQYSGRGATVAMIITRLTINTGEKATSYKYSGHIFPIEDDEKEGLKLIGMAKEGVFTEKGYPVPKDISIPHVPGSDERKAVENEQGKGAKVPMMEDAVFTAGMPLPMVVWQNGGNNPPLNSEIANGTIVIFRGVGAEIRGHYAGRDDAGIKRLLEQSTLEGGWPEVQLKARSAELLDPNPANKMAVLRKVMALGGASDIMAQYIVPPTTAGFSEEALENGIPPFIGLTMDQYSNHNYYGSPLVFEVKNGYQGRWSAMNPDSGTYGIDAEHPKHAVITDYSPDLAHAKKEGDPQLPVIGTMKNRTEITLLEYDPDSEDGKPFERAAVYGVAMSQEVYKLGITELGTWLNNGLTLLRTFQGLIVTTGDPESKNYDANKDPDVDTFAAKAWINLCPDWDEWLNYAGLKISREKAMELKPELDYAEGDVENAYARLLRRKGRPEIVNLNEVERSWNLIPQEYEFYIIPNTPMGTTDEMMHAIVDRYDRNTNHTPEENGDVYDEIAKKSKFVWSLNGYSVLFAHYKAKSG